MEPVTIRLEHNNVVISRDDGSTVIENEALARTLSELIRPFLARCEYGPTPAAALAAVAEAAVVVPNPRTLREPQRADARGPTLPIGGIACPLKVPFGDVLQARRSDRVFGRVALAEVATVMVHATRLRRFFDVDDFGFQAISRSAPSAGGRHPIEYFLVSRDIDGLGAGVWQFDSDRCELQSLTFSQDQAQLLEKTLAERLAGLAPPAAIVAVAQFERTLSRYPAGSTYVWRDAGAALAVLQLCATAAGLASCIVGCAAAFELSNSESLRADVGVLALGSTPDGATQPSTTTSAV